MKTYKFLQTLILTHSSIILGLSTIVSVPCLADESYNYYSSVGLAYILDQTSKITDDTTGHAESLYTNENYSYNIEAGVSIPLENKNQLHIGIYWSDLINQGISRKIHRPYKFEAFSDYVWEWDDKMFVKLGVGYKIFQDEKIEYHWQHCTYTTDLSKKSPIKNITARFAIGRHFGNYSLSLEHHSQWFQGRPISGEWEYETTNINLAYTF